MKRTLTIAALVALGAVAATLSVTAKSTNAPTKQQQIARGQYLVTIGGCNDCHTPWKMGAKGPEPDMSRMLSGHPESFPIESAITPASDKWMMTADASGTAFSGPWGVSFAANLTPDQNTGLGIWTEEMFMDTLRKGRHMGVSREILPPMPWFNYSKMTEEDLKAVYAFLRTIQPVQNHVPAPLPPAAPQIARTESE